MVGTPLEEIGQEDSSTWQCYTQKGFVEIEVEDQTKGFLEDGELCFTMPQEEAAVYEEGPLSGYIWRAVLTDADYDVAPEVLHLSGFLFEAWQKETLAITHTFQKPSEVVLTCTMMEEGYVRVYCKEEKGSSYRLYEEITEPEGEDITAGSVWATERSFLCLIKGAMGMGQAV